VTFDDFEFLSECIRNDQQLYNYCSQYDQFEFKPTQAKGGKELLKQENKEAPIQSTEHNKDKNPNIFGRICSRLSRSQEPKQIPQRPYGRSAMQDESGTQRRNTTRRDEVCDSLDEFMRKRTQTRALMKRLGDEDIDEYLPAM